MKHLLLLFLLFLPMLAKQNNIDYLNEVSLLIGDSENGSKQNIDRSIAYEIQFQYNGLDYAIKPEIAFVYSQDIPLYINTQESRTRYSMITLNGVYDIHYTDLVTPYLKAGLGYVSFSNVADSPDSSPLLDIGGGFKLHFTDRWTLKFEALALQGTEYLNILATGGISFAFGRKYVAPTPEKVCEPCPEPQVVKIEKKLIVIPTPTPVRVMHPEDIRFTFGKASLTDASKESIKGYAKDLNTPANINTEIIVIGNTDNIGPRTYNATLSLKRASSVRRAFIANDVDPKRITIDGLGETSPIADNETEEGREMNRRVTIILKEKNDKNN